MEGTSEDNLNCGIYGEFWNSLSKLTKSLYAVTGVRVEPIAYQYTQADDPDPLPAD